MQLVLADLQFPTSLAFDANGDVYIAESGLRFDGQPERARVLCRSAHGGPPRLLCDDLRAPVNGLTLFEGALYVAEGGCPGRISRLELDGRRTTILDDLPGGGNYHTNMVAIGRDRKLYFGQGAMTNSGVVDGEGQPHDLPGMDIVLGDHASATAAFAPYNTVHPAGTRLPAQLPCTAGIMRCNLDGSQLELVAWGLRNCYGLAFAPSNGLSFAPDGRLLALELGINDRGSRPVGNAPSCLYAIERGAWYGWPDFVVGEPVEHPRFASARGQQPRFLLANHSELPRPPAPLVSFPARAAAVKFTFGREHIYVALFGDKRPFTAPPGPAAGRAVVRVDLRDGSITPLVDEPLHRPIDLQVHPRDGSLYILDFGEYELLAGGQADAVGGSGKLWRLDAEAL